jgi:hypothetical protein
MGLLSDLDDRLLPGLARRLDHLVRKIPTPPEPSGPAPLIVRLRRLDDRWTARGPLALVRDVPQLGALLVLAVLVSGLGTLKVRSKPERRAPVAQDVGPSAEPSAGDPLGGHLGPDLGANVRLYIAAARVKLLRAASQTPDGTAVAVVGFTSYRTPEQVRDLLGPIVVARVMYRAPLKLPDGVTHQITVGDVVRDTRKDFLRNATELDAEAKRLLDLNKTIENDPAQVADQAKDAATFRREATVLRGPCACVYAVVVTARVRLLVDLLADLAVRVVDASPPGGTMEMYEFSGLLPEEKTTVTAGNQSG